jgi:hypothetical protein
MPVAGAVMVVYSIRNIIHEMIPLIRRTAGQGEGLKT